MALGVCKIEVESWHIPHGNSQPRPGKRFSSGQATVYSPTLFENNDRYTSKIIAFPRTHQQVTNGCHYMPLVLVGLE
jgi:hypothetical protein